MLGSEPFHPPTSGPENVGSPEEDERAQRVRGRRSRTREDLARRPVAVGEDRRLYLVEHDLRGLSSPQLASVHRALGEAVRRELRRGSPIRYVQRIDVPDEHRCLCLFEAPGPDLVRSVNDIAQFPLARVVAVLSSVPDDASPAADDATGRQSTC
jgi:Protein of unknown function (DUF4242)